MLTTSYRLTDGEDLTGIGLTHADLEALRRGKIRLIRLSELGIDRTGTIVLFAGETNDTIAARFSPATTVRNVVERRAPLPVGQ